MDEDKRIKPEPGFAAGCATRHARLTEIEVRVRAADTALAGERLRIDHLEDRVDGLGHAHQATILALEANTQALKQQAEWHSRQIDVQHRLNSSLDRLNTELNEVKFEHERDKRSLPKLALSVWFMGVGIVALVTYWLLHNWQWLIHAAAVLDTKAGG